ncbi:MAG: aspartate dehydrogenase [Ferrovibrio sp.]|uniref:aspartate dehydrogenase n=1 Tax=Ferrovibrio sp. TaxID=1917215 RepID=UPI00260CB1E0|nr:aspartate dehydrogenase [Ferrovibrio sp.]MCW0234012.1 aspartate dehydrogenase [Ferrovibrio sp.]
MPRRERPSILLIGHGAIAAEVRAAALSTGLFDVGAVLVRHEKVGSVQAELSGYKVIDTLEDLDFKPLLAAECASHSAVREYGPAVLRLGIDLVVASIGALSDDALHRELELAAAEGGAKLILPAGAVPGIDALNAATLGGLDRVSYISRKPPAAWKGTPAEQKLHLDDLKDATTFYTGSARAAAQDYPKNANVAATVALAGLGFDATEVRMIADPAVSANIHEIEASGAFGEMHLTIKGKPLKSNPKTSSLAAYSSIRAILNRVRPTEI